MNLRRVALTLLAALFLLAVPAVASAAVFTVDSTGDEGDKTLNGTCETNTPGECTLRAAIQESNASVAVKDDILFDLSVFQGQLADTIAPATVLPSLTSPVAINGATCLTAAGINGPCVGVNGPTGEVGFNVTADETSISGLAITGLSFGINVAAASTDFAARGNWVGVKLDGSAGGNSNFGIFIDPDSDGATIGGTEVVQRNVIANTTGTGLDLEGASEATIQGNYFGVGPNGTTQMSNGKDIEITGRTGFSPSEDVEAEDNEIGAAVEGAAATSAACDGGCNVISGSLGAGIDLNGIAIQSEKPASGPTVIHGNFIGLDATGIGELPNAGVGILAGGADHVTIGGAPGAANYLVGGSEAIFSGNDGDDFDAIGNSIGFRADGAAATSATSTGILYVALSVTEEPEIDSNDIRVAGPAGIEGKFAIGRVIDNDVEGGVNGILVGFGDGGGLIAGNTVEASTSTGILVKSSDNEIRRNTVLDSGAAGIAVIPPEGVTATTGNLIGGNSEERENKIEGSAGPAIEIFENAGEPGSNTEIARNNGSGNSGLFIDLKQGANEGIVSPAFSAATQSKAEGTADPETKIRVFRKAGGEAGELQSFLAETVADAGGNWKVTYPSIPAGTIVAATQTNVNGGTSELSTATASADPSTGGGGSSNGGGGGTTPTADTTAPKVTITKAPKAKSAGTTAKFKFKSNEAGSKFQCKLDKGKFVNCKSPKTYKKLKPGKHVFKVRAIDKAGNVGKPAKRKFTVVT